VRPLPLLTFRLALALAACLVAIPERAAAQDLTQGDILVVDTLANEIFRIVCPPDPAPGSCVQASFPGSSGFSFPRSVTVDRNGDLFVADEGSGTILRVDADGTQDLVALGFAGIRALAADPASGDLFALDAVDQFLVRVDVVTGGQTPVGGGNFLFPSGLAREADGQLLVTDAFFLVDVGLWVLRIDPDQFDDNNRTSNQTILTQLDLFDTPRKVTVSDTGEIFVTDSGADAVFRVDCPPDPAPDSCVQVPVASGGNLIRPVGIAALPAGNVCPPAKACLLVVDADAQALKSSGPLGSSRITALSFSPGTGGGSGSGSASVTRRLPSQSTVMPVRLSRGTDGQIGAIPAAFTGRTPEVSTCRISPGPFTISRWPSRSRVIARGSARPVTSGVSRSGSCTASRGSTR
jgi:streptogramin lyase